MIAGKYAVKMRLISYPPRHLLRYFVPESIPLTLLGSPRRHNLWLTALGEIKSIRSR